MSCSQFYKIMPLVIIGIFLFQTPSYAKKCRQSNTTPEVNVVIKKGKLFYDLSKSTKQLTELSTGINNTGPSMIEVRGLATMKPTFRPYIEILSQKIGANSYCAYVSKITLTIGYSDLRVYISNNYSEGSCQFIAIMKHEVKHVTAYRQGMNRNKNLYTSALKKAASKLQTVKVKKTDDAFDIFGKYLNKKINPIFENAKQKLEFANSKIDSPESYKRIQKKCSSW